MSAAAARMPATTTTKEAVAMRMTAKLAGFTSISMGTPLAVFTDARLSFKRDVRGWNRERQIMRLAAGPPKPPKIQG